MKEVTLFFPNKDPERYTTGESTHYQKNVKNIINTTNTNNGFPQVEIWEKGGKKTKFHGIPFKITETPEE